MIPPPPRSTLFPYTTLFRSHRCSKSGISAITGGKRRSPSPTTGRSEEHTSELQSHLNLVCRLLLEKKNNTLYEYQQMTTKRPTDGATRRSLDYTRCCNRTSH